jgi:cytochrome c
MLTWRRAGARWRIIIAQPDWVRSYTEAVPAMSDSSILRTAFAITALVFATSTAQAQDLEAGQRSFNKCRACHQVGEGAKNTIGPMMNGLFGRKSGTIEGYSYSDANKNSGIIWDEVVFAEYIRDPKAKIPGTKMVFVGIKGEQEIKDLIAYLKQFAADGKKL